MGMFSTYENFEDHFKEGDTFTLQNAKMGALMNTRHGEAQQVVFQIDGKGYSAFGAGFVAQVQRLEKGDLPAEVEFCKQPAKVTGNSPTKILWPVGQPKPWEGDTPGADIPF